MYFHEYKYWFSRVLLAMAFGVFVYVAGYFMVDSADGAAVYKIVISLIVEPNEIYRGRVC